MNITDLLSPCPALSKVETAPIHDDDLMSVWEQLLHQCGFRLKATCERNTLTDAILSPSNTSDERHLQYSQQFHQSFIKDTPIHIKVIGRHMNGSFRCHIGTGKASRPIQSVELGQQMRLLAVFFRAENCKSQLVSPNFIFFPTWLFHLFRYTQHDASPGRTDVRFLEDASLAKEDHIYRLNHVLNSLFRFTLRKFNGSQFWHSVALANYLFDHVGLDCHSLPSPTKTSLGGIIPPTLYCTLINYLHAPRPIKSKPMCSNCNTKAASRRKLCVACYRYQLKHGEPRPLRLIIANRPGPRQQLLQQQQQQQQDQQQRQYTSRNGTTGDNLTAKTKSASKPATTKHCANCGVHETHQWYRNLCGQGHWCETCKSYYIRHNKVRPPELFVKAAKRRVDVRSLVSYATSSWDQQESLQQQQQRQQLEQYQQEFASHLEQNDRRLSTCSSLSSSSVNTILPPAQLDDTFFVNNGIASSPTEATSSSSSPLSVSSTIAHSSAMWSPSGCRPHLYHPRNSSNSGCNSPNSVSLPSTPPLSTATSTTTDHHRSLIPGQVYVFSAGCDTKYTVSPLPSLQRSFDSPSDYDGALFDCL